MSQWEESSTGANKDWRHICAIFGIQRIDPCSEAVIKQSMALAAAKLKVSLEGEDAPRGRRLALLDIFNSYGGRDRGA
jgi:hypothetical protein